MDRIADHLPALGQLIRMQLQVTLTRRFALIIRLFILLLLIFALKMIWTAVYAGAPSHKGVPLEALITYLTIANLQLWLTQPNIAFFLEQRVHRGEIAFDLVRPLGSLTLVPLLVVALPFALIFGGLRPPASIGAAVAYLVSLALGYAITVLMGLLLGTLAFWTVRVGAFFEVYRYVAQFFAGALIPLCFMPDLVRTLTELLPFQTQAFIPVGIYVGQISGPAIGRAIGIQVIWLLVLGGLAVLVWGRAIRKVAVYGG